MTMQKPQKIGYFTITIDVNFTEIILRKKYITFQEIIKISKIAVLRVIP